MPDNPYAKWAPQIELAINKHAVKSGPDERQDIRQEIMVAFVEAHETLFKQDAGNEDKARGLAYKIARNAIFAYYRPIANKIPRAAVSLDDPVIQRGVWYYEKGLSRPDNRFFHSLVEAVSTGPPVIDMDRALSSLSEDEQRVVRGLFFEGRTQKEMAAELGQTRHWVREKKGSALKELKRLLQN